MRIFKHILLWSVTVMFACNTRFERYPVQGKWKIEQVSYQFQDNHDSIAKSNLGHIIFDECSQDDNEMVKCMGTRIYPNGEKSTFYFRTMRDVYENERKQTIELARRSSADKVSDELRGSYFIEKLTGQEMILVCYNCGVGALPDMANRFELRATKVQE